MAKSRTRRRAGDIGNNVRARWLRREEVRKGDGRDVRHQTPPPREGEPDHGESFDDRGPHRDKLIRVPVALVCQRTRRP